MDRSANPMPLRTATSNDEEFGSGVFSGYDADESGSVELATWRTICEVACLTPE